MTVEGYDWRYGLIEDPKKNKIQSKVFDIAATIEPQNDPLLTTCSAHSFSSESIIRARVTEGVALNVHATCGQDKRQWFEDPHRREIIPCSFTVNMLYLPRRIPGVLYWRISNAFSSWSIEIVDRENDGEEEEAPPSRSIDEKRKE